MGHLPMHDHSVLRRFYPLIFIGLATALAGCMLGPDFKHPDAPKTNGYTAKPLPKHTVATPGAGGKPQTYVVNRDIPVAWWELFHDKNISALVEQGIANSPTMAAAQASLINAQETLNAQIGNSLFPAFNANVGGTRQRVGSGQGLGSPGDVFNTFNANVSVSYTLDVFGGARREIEALAAQVDYQQFNLIATYLTLTSNIVITSLNLASITAQIGATHDLIKAAEGELRLMKDQYALGAIPLTNVLAQQTLVDQTKATLPPLQQQAIQAEHALAALIGRFPDTEIPHLVLNKIRLPKDIPISLPSNLVRQRPDVRASEALLHAASAQIGVATANLFPQFTLSAADGWSADVASSLFTPSTKVWSLASQITQPIFHGGALFASRRAAIAAYDQAGAQYQQTVLQAFQNVADTLRALANDARTFQAQKAAEIAARKNWVITRQQFALGGVSYINLLSAEQSYQQSRISSIQAQAARYVDTATLYQALGGGWWNRSSSLCDAANRTNASLQCP
ncbi:MAG TPA: efflux transporter outer membrane subunit [Gammaproteobacteria bacterium]|jgi:NodT family efflux transporter outer membrane factor (OMF) lipoprotein|nr:efflux transporter outer membrane subunit [Gammaproteobacteria bacterium]